MTRSRLTLITAGICLFVGLGLSGCSPAAPPITPAESARLTPADDRLASLYETSCKTCHAIAGSGAPLAGDGAAWKPRLAQGMPTLVDHTVQGFKAMPAGGQCARCSPDDYRALISFMSGTEKR
jgi:cytochrome c5